MKDAWESITTDEHDTALLLFFAILQLKKHFNAFLVSPELRRPKLPSHPQLIYLPHFHSFRCIAKKISKCQWMKCSHWGMIRNFSRASRNPFEFKMEIIINSWFYIDFTFSWKGNLFFTWESVYQIFSPETWNGRCAKKEQLHDFPAFFPKITSWNFNPARESGDRPNLEKIVAKFCGKTLANRKNLRISRKSCTHVRIMNYVRFSWS